MSHNQEKETVCLKNERSVIHLIGFFDLLAKFDFEDKQTERSVLKTGPLVSAPRGSVFSADTK